MRAALAFAVALGLIALGLLAGCGKKGLPDPPGPPNKISYPKTYPAPALAQ